MIYQKWLIKTQDFVKSKNRKIIDEKKLTILEAFYALTLFLEKFYLETHSEDITVLLSGMQIGRDGDTWDSAMWQDWLKSINKVKSEENIGEELTPLQAFKAMRYYFEIWYELTHWPDIEIILNMLHLQNDGKPARQDVWNEWEIYISQSLHEECSSLCDCPKYEDKKEKKLAAHISFCAMILLLEKFYLEADCQDLKILLEEKKILKQWNDAHTIKEEWLDCFYKVLLEDKRMLRYLTPLQAFRAMRYFLELYQQKTGSLAMSNILNTYLLIEDGKPIRQDIWKDWEMCIIQALHAWCTTSCDCPDLAMLNDLDKE